jgi:hypothetical protein
VQEQQRPRSDDRKPTGCRICSKEHQVVDCGEFLAMGLDERVEACKGRYLSLHVFEVFRRHISQFCKLQMQNEMRNLSIDGTSHTVTWDQEISPFPKPGVDTKHQPVVTRGEGDSRKEGERSGPGGGPTRGGKAKAKVSDLEVADGTLLGRVAALEKKLEEQVRGEKKRKEEEPEAREKGPWHPSEGPANEGERNREEAPCQGPYTL